MPAGRLPPACAPSSSAPATPASPASRSPAGSPPLREAELWLDVAVLEAADRVAPAFDDAFAGAVPTDAADPSTLGALERRVLGPTVELSTAVLGEGAVDLTGLTRPADRDHPGAPANRLFRGPFGPVGGGDR